MVDKVTAASQRESLGHMIKPLLKVSLIKELTDQT
jgi:hypothetical protein